MAASQASAPLGAENQAVGRRKGQGGQTIAMSSGGFSAIGSETWVREAGLHTSRVVTDGGPRSSRLILRNLMKVWGHDKQRLHRSAHVRTLSGTACN